MTDELVNRLQAEIDFARKANGRSVQTIHTGELEAAALVRIEADARRIAELERALTDACHVMDAQVNGDGYMQLHMRDDDLADARTLLKRWEEALSGTTPAEPSRDALVEALQIIAGERQCLDNLMSDKDVARAALAAHRKENHDDE